MISRRLAIKVLSQEQQGPDIRLCLGLSEPPESGTASTALEVTLHDVQEVDIGEKGLCATTKDGAPVVVAFEIPLECHGQI
ncbi:MAG: hypothetical protein ABH810_03130 [bacterium]